MAARERRSRHDGGGGVRREHSTDPLSDWPWSSQYEKPGSRTLRLAAAIERLHGRQLKAPAAASWPVELQRPDSRDGTPAGRTRGNDLPASTDERSSQIEDVFESARAPNHDDVKAAPEAVYHRLHSLADDLDACKAELPNHGAEKRRPPVPGLDQRKCHAGEDDLQRQSRESGARTQVGDGSVVHRSDPREEETVQEQMVGDPAALDGSNEALNLLPFPQYFQIVVELAQLALGQLTTEDYAGVLHELRA